VWAVAPLALIVVGARAFGLYRGADALLTAENKSKNWVDVQAVIETAVTVITLIGAVLAGLYAYRKQLLSEGDSHRADANQLAERYSKAAEQLGHDQAAVRLAGVYAMGHLADDWPEQRQVCIDVLCAYLRMPYEADPTEPGFMKGEREVRLTIIRTIRDHLQDPTSAHGMVWPRPGLHRSHLRRRGLQPCGVHRCKGQLSSSRTAVPVRGRPLREPRARAGGRIHARWVLWRSAVPPRASHRLRGARWSAQAGCLR
jgi:hypothetical protein